MNLFYTLSPDKAIANYSFNMKAQIGKGSSGTVYIGKNDIDNTPVAIKVVDLNNINNAYTVKMLCSEIEIMKKLSNPHIVKLLDVFQTKNNTYIIQEYCNGGDLRQLLLQQKQFTYEQSISIFKQIVMGLYDLMNNGIIHRDLKPGNIILHDGVFKIADFGFARQIDDVQKDMMSSLVGTPLYMSPQILQRQQYTGIILYELIYGTTPWPSHNIFDLNNNIQTKPLIFNSSVQISQEVKGLIQKCLQYNEHQRMSLDELLSNPIFNNEQNDHYSNQKLLTNILATPIKMTPLKKNAQEKENQFGRKQLHIQCQQIQAQNHARIISNVQQTPQHTHSTPKVILERIEFTPVKKRDTEPDKSIKKEIKLTYSGCEYQGVLLPTQNQNSNRSTTTENSSVTSSKQFRIQISDIEEKSDNVQNISMNEQLNQEFSKNQQIINGQVQLCRHLKQLKQLLDQQQSLFLSIKDPIFFDKISFILLKNQIIKLCQVNLEQIINENNVFNLTEWQMFKQSESFISMKPQIKRYFVESFNQYQNYYQRLQENQDFFKEAQNDLLFKQIFNSEFKDNNHFYKISQLYIKIAIKEFNRIQSEKVRQTQMIELSSMTLLKKLINYHEILQTNINNSQQFPELCQDGDFEKYFKCSENVNNYKDYYEQIVKKVDDITQFDISMFVVQINPLNQV